MYIALCIHSPQYDSLAAERQFIETASHCHTDESNSNRPTLRWLLKMMLSLLNTLVHTQNVSRTTLMIMKRPSDTSRATDRTEVQTDRMCVTHVQQKSWIPLKPWADMSTFSLMVLLVGVLITTPTCDGRPNIYQLEQKPTNFTQLEDIFIGRCWEFQTLVRPDLFRDGEKDCNELWKLFTGAFMYKDPCGVNETDFRKYVSAAAHTIPKDSAILWSALSPFVYHYSDHGLRGTALADYLPGYLAQDTTFCGSTGPPGINNTYCPKYNDACEGETNFNFWREVSTQFAQRIRGMVRVALNGTRADNRTAFGNRSIFTQRELPNLKPPNVTHVEVWLVHDIGKKKVEMCGEGSLKTLEDIVLNRNMRFSCLDDPPETLHLQCVSNPHARECQLQNVMLSTGAGFVTGSSIVMVILLALHIA